MPRKRLKPDFEIRVMAVLDVGMVFTDRSGGSLTFTGTLDSPVLKAVKAELTIINDGPVGGAGGHAAGASEGIWRLAVGVSNAHFNLVWSASACRQIMRIEIVTDALRAGMGSVKSVSLFNNE